MIGETLAHLRITAKLGEGALRRVLATTGILPPLDGIVTLDELQKVLGAFEAHGLDYVLIGGGAINVHGLLRTTEDIDVMVSPAPENIARLKASLKSLWDDPSIDEIEAEELAGAYPALRYVPPEGELYLDVVTRFGKAFAFDDIERERVSLGELEITIATPRALLRMKKDTERPVDRQDALELMRRFDLDPSS